MTQPPRELRRAETALHMFDPKRPSRSFDFSFRRALPTGQEAGASPSSTTLIDQGGGAVRYTARVFHSTSERVLNLAHETWSTIRIS